MRANTICAIAAAIVVLMFSGASRASETVPSLPEIDGWTCGEPRSVSLDAVSGNQGLWIERDYRTDAGVSLKATLLHGPGPKFYNQPQAGVSSRAGASSYEIISIGGYKSSIEYDPVLGYAVAANAFERKFSLTAEFGAFHERDEVIRCVEILLDAIK